ncbi:MAG TPA: hypothetical protein PKE07_08160 [Lacibacter sp.]|nr:hypothetical protein [Lacibacter sp.]HMO89880.1 hypothetical protein [Lacibacter sp.]
MNHSTTPAPSQHELQETIASQLEQPAALERLYRTNPSLFGRAFDAVFPDIQSHPAAQTWHERLHFKQEGLSLGAPNELPFVLVLAALAGGIAKIPDITGVSPDYFFPRNIGFIVLPFLMAYFLRKQQTPAARLLLPTLAVVLPVIYINFLPGNDRNDTFVLACIHLPLFLWTLLGYAFTGAGWKDPARRTAYLRFNGDLLIMGVLLGLAGLLFTGLTMGLFSLVGIRIEEFYARYIAVWGLAALPLVATFLVHNNPQLVNRISPLIARIFTPLVFVTLLLFLGAVLFTGKNLYNDRDFLLLFNGILLAVMALVMFGVTEATKNSGGTINLFFLTGLSFVALVINGLALSAIVFRLAEYGLTPNRVAVLGGNLLLFINLLLVSRQLLQLLRGKATVENVEKVLVLLLPVYAAWTALVTFALPLLFQFR